MRDVSLMIDSMRYICLTNVIKTVGKFPVVICLTCTATFWLMKETLVKYNLQFNFKHDQTRNSSESQKFRMTTPTRAIFFHRSLGTLFEKSYLSSWSTCALVHPAPNTLYTYLPFPTAFPLALSPLHHRDQPHVERPFVHPLFLGRGVHGAKC